MARYGLDERSKDVLKTLILTHIATGEPVGSETLARHLSGGLSPATIRNIMADLEKLGFLSHPHTSAGRIPTDEGYRFYVDSLMGRRPLRPRDTAAIRTGLSSRDTTPIQVMENASHLLSRLSGSVGFALAPDIARATFRHIDLVQLPHARILVVMVSQTGLVTNRVIGLGEEISQDELQACANYLNAQFAGMTLAAIRARLLELMGQEKALYDSLLRNAISVGRHAFSDEGDGGNVFLDGTAKLLEQPEFVDMAKMQAIFKTFEEKGRLVKILNACISGGGLRVIIGHENPDPDLRDIAIVTAGYPVDGGAGWGLGVLGSTRMQYPRVVELVDQVGRAVSEALTELQA
jgi:heat-inducible transcriptional repressor